jgi:hypothetical protein
MTVLMPDLTTVLTHRSTSPKFKAPVFSKSDRAARWAARIGYKTMTVADQRSRDLIQRTILSSLSRFRKTIARSQTNGVVCWRLV